LTQIKAFKDAAAEDSLKPSAKFKDMTVWEAF